jgi:hypothetical protein
MLSAAVGWWEAHLEVVTRDAERDTVPPSGGVVVSTPGSHVDAAVKELLEDTLLLGLLPEPEVTTKVHPDKVAAGRSAAV